jgi:LuxR family transcriptional regulator, maltose regulon positive regulatory protein
MRYNSTKLFRPPVPDDYIHRPRLHERLNLIARRPLALVSAPAGYGKTTTVSAWIGDSDLNCGWLSLDERDNDLTHFLAYFVAAIRRALPTFGAELELMLDAGSPPSPQRFVEFIDLELDNIAQPVVLVLDEFQTIRHDEVLKVIRELMRHPHPDLHLVIVSRHDPQLPLSD